MSTSISRYQYDIDLSFEEVHLPPFNDILLLAHKCRQGKNGITKCFNFLEPDRFELIEIEDEIVEAMLVNKSIIKRMPAERIIEVLNKTVFPYISIGEIIKVDFRVKVKMQNIYLDGALA